MSIFETLVQRLTDTPPSEATAVVSIARETYDALRQRPCEDERVHFAILSYVVSHHETLAAQIVPHEHAHDSAAFVLYLLLCATAAPLLRQPSRSAEALGLAAVGLGEDWLRRTVLETRDALRALRQDLFSICARAHTRQVFDASDSRVPWGTRSGAALEDNLRECREVDDAIRVFTQKGFKEGLAYQLRRQEALYADRVYVASQEYVDVMFLRVVEAQRAHIVGAAALEAFDTRVTAREALREAGAEDRVAVVEDAVHATAFDEVSEDIETELVNEIFGTAMAPGERIVALRKDPDLAKDASDPNANEMFLQSVREDRAEDVSAITNREPHLILRDLPANHPFVASAACSLLSQALRGHIPPFDFFRAAFARDTDLPALGLRALPEEPPCILLIHGAPCVVSGWSLYPAGDIYEAIALWLVHVLRRRGGCFDREHSFEGVWRVLEAAARSLAEVPFQRREVLHKQTKFGRAQSESSRAVVRIRREPTQPLHDFPRTAPAENVWVSRRRAPAPRRPTT